MKALLKYTLLSRLMILGCMACSSGEDPGGADTDSSDGTGGDRAAASGGSSGADPSGGAGPAGSGGDDAASGGRGGSGPQFGDADFELGSIGIVLNLASNKVDSGPRGQINIYFVPDPAVDQVLPEDRGCVYETFGACRISTCKEWDGEGYVVPVSLEAGTMTFLADGEPLAVAEPNFDYSNGYRVAWDGAYGGGELVSISAEGGRVEAFSTEIALPLAPLLITPAVEESTMAVVNVPVPRDRDFSFTWDARETSESVVVDLESNRALNKVGLYCSFDAKEGAGVIPAAALAKLATGSVLHLWAGHHQNVQLTDGYVRIVGLFEVLSSNRVSYPQFVLE